MTPETGLPGIPDRLSDLIRLAIHGARSLDSSVYRPSYNSWHSWHTGFPGKCHFCDAGAVIASTLVPACDRYKGYLSLGPKDFPHPWQHALFALDAAREGDVYLAYAHLGHAQCPGEPIDDTPYDTTVQDILDDLGPNEKSEYGDWDAFHAHLAWMEELASRLDRIEPSGPAPEPKGQRR